VDKELPELFSMGDMVAELGLSALVLRRAIERGDLAAYWIGRRWCCSREQIEAWLMRIEKYTRDL